MRRPLATLTLLVVLCGCPGQRRPPPAEPVASEAPAKTAVVEEPSSPVFEVSVAGLKAGLAELRRECDSFAGASAGTDAHDRLMDQVNAVQTLAFKLQESEDDAVLDEVYPLLEELEEIRDDAVQLEPK